VPSAASPLGGADAAAAAFSSPPSPSAASLSPPSPSPRVRARRRVFRLGAPALRLPRSLPRSRPLRRLITVLTFLLTVPCITDRKCHDVTGLRMGRDPHAPFASLRSSALHTPLPTRTSYTHTPSPPPQTRVTRVYLASTLIFTYRTHLFTLTRYDTFPHKGEKSGLCRLTRACARRLCSNRARTRFRALLVFLPREKSGVCACARVPQRDKAPQSPSEFVFPCVHETSA